MPELSTEEVIAGLNKLLDDPPEDAPITQGQIARNIGCSRTTLWRFRKDNNEIAALVRRVESEVSLDWGISKLKERINAGSDAATIYYLKSKGKDFGWSERHEVTGADGGGVKVEVEYVNEAEPDAASSPE